MASITDPVAQQWYDQRVRPASRKLQELRYMLDVLEQEYTSGVSAILGGFAGTDTMDHVPGNPVLTKDEIVTWVSNANTVLSMLETDAAMGAVAGRYTVLAEPSNDIQIG